MAKKVPLHRLRDISKQRSIRRHNPLQDASVRAAGSDGWEPAQQEWPLGSSPLKI
jgi:hypothetical protein